MSKVTFTDVSLEHYTLTDRLRWIKQAYFGAIPEICTDRPRLLTEFHLQHGLLGKDRISILDKAKAYRYVLEHRAAVVWHTTAADRTGTRFPVQDESLFAGSTTSKFKGVPLFPEYLALSLWPELETIGARSQNPYSITSEDRTILNRDVFPHWMDNSLLELARAAAKSETDPDFQLMERLVFFITTKPNCISHTVPDFSRAVRVGLRAMIDEAKQKQSTANGPKQKEVFAAFVEVLEGICTYSRRLAARADVMAATETDESRKRQLLTIAKIHRRVPEQRAETFREGLTTVWLCWTAVHLENPNVGLSLGRLDQLLYDLYRRDIDEKRLTVADAIELVGNLWIKIGDHVPTVPEAGEQLFGGTGSNQAITIGGVDEQGKDAVNDLTYVMLRATELMMLRDPNLNARYMPGVSSRDYLERICLANMRTKATPAIHNDRAVIHALTKKGDSLEHARDYAVVGCVEPCSNGRHYGHSGALLINLTSALELALFNGKHRHTLETQIGPKTGDAGHFQTFDQFRAAFETQVRWLVDKAVALNNALGRTHQRYYPTPILSALFEGPWESGKDVIDGGAKINSSGATIVGLADVADSLSAIEKVVFAEKRYTLPRLLEELSDNFTRDSQLYELLNNRERTPKYGNEDKVADANAQWVVKLLDGVFSAKENYRGGRYRVGYWTMTNHAGFGRMMKATPNGRKAHQNFTSGITPVSAMTPELTKALHSVAMLPSECMSSGVALNIKYTPEGSGHLDKEMVQRFAATVEAYFDGEPGGMEIQFNVTDHDSFLRAIKEPDPELLVRVSGYTAYFKDLNPQMKQEIIDRTEYALSTGKMQKYPPYHVPGAAR